LQTYSARLDPHRALYHSTTQYWDTHRCTSHYYQLRRGTPLTRSWLMPALSAQRFATVLTHPSACFSHAEYHYCMTVYRSDVQSELQSACKEYFIFAGLTLFPFLTHTSTYFSHAEYHYCILFFSPNAFAIIKFNYADLKIRLFIMMYLHA